MIVDGLSKLECFFVKAFLVSVAFGIAAGTFVILVMLFSMPVPVFKVAIAIEAVSVVLSIGFEIAAVLAGDRRVNHG